MSSAPPAGTGTTMVIGRDGNACAVRHNASIAGSAKAPAARGGNRRRCKMSWIHHTSSIQFSLKTILMKDVTACRTCRVASGSWPRCGPSATQPSL